MGCRSPVIVAVLAWDFSLYTINPASKYIKHAMPDLVRHQVPFLDSPVKPGNDGFLPFLLPV